MKYQVAPFTGAWIEITVNGSQDIGKDVAPFTGAWIEMKNGRPAASFLVSVAPFTGAWIEILKAAIRKGVCTSRTLHGCVD